MRFKPKKVPGSSSSSDFAGGEEGPSGSSTGGGAGVKKIPPIITLFCVEKHGYKWP